MLKNLNLANANNFKLEIPGLDSENYLIQSCNLPSITMPAIDVPYQINVSSTYANTPNYSQLGIVFLMDEEFVAYKDIINWMQSFNTDGDSWKDLLRDIKLHILSANKKPLIIFTFHGAFPVAINEVTYESNVTEPTPLAFSTEWRYQEFAVE